MNNDDTTTTNNNSNDDNYDNNNNNKDDLERFQRVAYLLLLLFDCHQQLDLGSSTSCSGLA